MEMKNKMENENSTKLMEGNQQSVKSEQEIQNRQSAKFQEVTLENQQSVEFSINAKGKWSGKVKVYSTTIEDAYKKALDYATAMEELIKQKNG